MNGFERLMKAANVYGENSKEDISENFIDRHKEIFAKTKPAGLELGVTMNNAFFNELLKYETLDSLMNECCDYYTFMLYNSDYQIYHADSLIEYAKLFNKKVEIISEMQKMYLMIMSIVV